MARNKRQQSRDDRRERREGQRLPEAIEVQRPRQPQVSEKDYWEQRASKIAGRTWDNLRDLWLEYLPDLSTPGLAPETTISELPSVEEISQSLNDDPEDIDEELEGLRNGVLTEGIFLLHKSAHVLGAAQLHISQGLRSWSLSSAYHAAFFAMKSILHFQGIAVVESNNKTFILDVWHRPVARNHNKFVSNLSFRFVKVRRAEQRHLWLIFQRTLRVLNMPENLWPRGFVDTLIDLDFKSFGKQRNDIHYLNTWWPYIEDLHESVIVEDYCRINTGLDGGDTISDPETREFPVFLGIILLRMASQMFEDLAKLSPRLKAEWELIDTWSKNDFNRLYRYAFAIN